MAAEVGSMASMWAHAESTAPSTSSESKQRGAPQVSRGSSTKVTMGGRRRGRGGTPSKKLIAHSEPSTSANEPAVMAATDTRNAALQTQSTLAPSLLPTPNSLPPKPSLNIKQTPSAPKPRRSNSSVSSRNAEGVPKEDKAPPDAASARKLARRRGKTNSTNRSANTTLESSPISEVPDVAVSPTEDGSLVGDSELSKSKVGLGSAADLETVDEIVSVVPATAAPPILSSELDVSVVSLANPPRAFTPISQLDWADEDDADGLPSLDDWGIPAKPRRKGSSKSDAAAIPSLSNQTQPQNFLEEPALLDTDRSNLSEASSAPHIEISATSKRILKKSLERRIPTSKPILLPVTIQTPESPPRPTPLNTNLTVPRVAGSGTSLTSASSSPSSTTAGTPEVRSVPLAASASDSKSSTGGGAGRGRKLDPEEGDKKALEKKKAKLEKLKEKRAAAKLARKAEKSAAASVSVSPVSAGEGSQPTDAELPDVGEANNAEGRSLLSRIGGYAVTANANGSSQGEDSSNSTSTATDPGLSLAPLTLSVTQQPAELMATHISTSGPIRTNRSRPPPASPTSSSFSGTADPGARKRNTNPNSKQPFTFPSQRRAPPESLERKPSPGPGSSSRGARPTRGRGPLQQAHHSNSRPVISSTALNQLSKSLSGGSRTHNSSAVDATS